MSGKKPQIGVVLCTSAAVRYTTQETERIGRGIGDHALVEASIGTERQLAALATKITRRGFVQVLLAGVSPLRQGELLVSIARRTGLSPAAVHGVELPAGPRSRNKAARAIEAIGKGLAALSLTPRFETRRIPLNSAVLVVGAGAAGTQTAAALRSLGHPTTIVEDNDKAGPESLRNAGPVTGGRVRRLDGQVGAFTVTVRTPAGDEQLTCGALVLASGTPLADPVQAPFNGTTVLPVGNLAEAASRLPRRRGARSLGIVLDYQIDETKASTESALRLALSLQRDRGFQVHLFCRDMRVAGMELEKLYDQAREAGVDIVKFEGRLSLQSSSGKTVGITCRDSILGQVMSLECELIGISPYGVASAAGPDLARLFGVSVDSLGQLQANNIHLFPGETNRPGIFVAGSCRGQHYLPQIRAEASATALAVHSLLGPGYLEVELSQPVVNADKCVLCLTCVRSCPHQAMYVDHEKGAAASSPEACRRCGICAGECPAKAIELPAFSDRVVLSQVSSAR